MYHKDLISAWCKVKIKLFVLIIRDTPHNENAWRSGGVTPKFFKLSIILLWVVSFIPHRGTTLGTHWREGCVRPRAAMDATEKRKVSSSCRELNSVHTYCVVCPPIHFNAFLLHPLSLRTLLAAAVLSVSIPTLRLSCLLFILSSPSQSVISASQNHYKNDSFQGFDSFTIIYIIIRARCNVVGWPTVLQVRRSRFRFPMR
jgi:hypothetical protein